jgi:hypothetical protein
MKLVLIALFFVTSAFAQAQSVGLPPACGPKNVSFDVKLDKSQHTQAPPEPGKARVYFLQDSFVARIGMDGAWVGANRGHSYFSVSVEPGEHHVCAKVDVVSEHPVEVASFTAEAGKVYYFRARLVSVEGGLYLFLAQADNDEAKYLMDSYSLSVSQPKK